MNRRETNMATSPQRPFSLTRTLTRRAVLRTSGIGGLGVAASLLVGCGGDDDESPGEGAPEVKTIRLPHFYGTCFAPQYVARPFLIEAGFEKVEYVAQGRLSETTEMLDSGATDLALEFASSAAVALDEGAAIVAIAAAHVGCYELFAQEGIQRFAELRGKAIGISQANARAADYRVMQHIMSFIGIDITEYDLQAHDFSDVIRLFGDGQLDAVLAYPPLTNQLRTLNLGHVILNSMTDREYAQHACCLVLVNKDFLNKNPVATKLALKSVLRGADFCATQPEAAARYLVDKHSWVSYDYAFEAMKSIPYDVWRGYDAEDTLRHYALRLHEAHVIKSTPDEIIRKGTDWRFLNELKQEMAYFPPADPTRSAFALDCAIQGPQEG